MVSSEKRRSGSYGGVYISQKKTLYLFLLIIIEMFVFFLANLLDDRHFHNPSADTDLHIIRDFCNHRHLHLVPFFLMAGLILFAILAELIPIILHGPIRRRR